MKKTYLKPQVDVIELNTSNFLATSGVSESFDVDDVYDEEGAVEQYSLGIDWHINDK